MNCRETEVVAIEQHGVVVKDSKIIATLENGEGIATKILHKELDETAKYPKATLFLVLEHIPFGFADTAFTASSRAISSINGSWRFSVSRVEEDNGRYLCYGTDTVFDYEWGCWSTPDAAYGSFIGNPDERPTVGEDVIVCYFYEK